MSLPAGCIAINVSLYLTEHAGGAESGTWEVTPQRTIRWAATDQVLLRTPIQRRTRAGRVSMLLPATDQTGFVGDNGEPVTSWGYRFRFRPDRAQDFINETFVQLPSALAPAVSLGQLIPLGGWPDGGPPGDTSADFAFEQVDGYPGLVRLVQIGG